jgi:hypothetical protein
MLAGATEAADAAPGDMERQGQTGPVACTA